MLAIIGGLMLAMAVAAMVVLAGWSLARDEYPDSQPRDGMLALREWSDRAVKRKHGENRVKRDVTTRERKEHAMDQRRDATLRKLGKPKFDKLEMADIEEEIARAKEESQI